MYLKLAIFSAFLGLIIIAAALFTILSIRRQSKGGQGTQTLNLYFMRWTVFDYAVLLLFVCGMLFLLADVLGVVRDRLQYPYWHYGYLLCGFVFSLLGMLFTVIRLAIVLKMAGAPDLFPVDNHRKPNETDAAKDGV